MISEGGEGGGLINSSKFRLILEAKFGKDPLQAV